MPNSTAQYPEKDSWEFLVKSGIAGGTAGCVAKSVVAPLDRVKILYQTNHASYRGYAYSRHGLYKAIKHIYHVYGLHGLYQGHTATLYRVFPYAGIKFVAYEQVRRVLIRDPEHETHARRFLSGSLAGTCSVFFTYPLELIRVRLAYITNTGKNPTLTQVTKDIFHERDFLCNKKYPGLSRLSKICNFYRGFSVTLTGIFPYAGMSFLAYDLATDFFHKQKIDEWVSTKKSDKKLKTWPELLCGAFAGVCGQTVSYPFEVCRRKMQIGGIRKNKSFLRLKQVVQTTYKEAGMRGFFVGLTIGYIKVIPMVSTSFFVYNHSKALLGID
ncbi:Coenzyme A transporter [Schizosaccharomyces pombe]|uniref:Uncharacterized mitochondrial carrier C17H9.08 n=1 Tax=Schizosaccharomyces pombe (strain 972 / ATCC 24843) TaxID=284812 RepID=YE08_SCHPO|nr:putative coenzyme A transporter [Schizosaccharomyces pombe]O13805.1 RecName: Full=Uncharacterized mitochondrial carrier C17H9.08 [Schizosaccharomyces pombe 972h-]CAB11217.1 mitochondrial coenzyme A transporter (predicted) [Schizosaccharomyces pombe]|eukprot:NP_593578.1 putative coenzyme A transporter [Schizosaccharomyces pombe]